jgi:hypothetical protein
VCSSIHRFPPGNCALWPVTWKHGAGNTPKTRTPLNFYCRRRTFAKGWANIPSKRRLSPAPGISMNSAGKPDEIVFAMVANLKQLDQPMAAIKTLTTYQGKLSKSGKRRSFAELAVLHMGLDHRSQAQKYSRLAKKAYRPEMVRTGPFISRSHGRTDLS